MNDHVHDFADDDTVTVREIREVLERFTGRNVIRDILRDISERREPEYPAYSVWKDDNGVIWQRTSQPRSRYGQWLRMGMDGIHGDSSPQRPLKRMDVT
jgi:hypothetical protein